MLVWEQHICRHFLSLSGCIMLSSKDYIAEGSITQLVLLVASVATVMTCLGQREQRGGHLEIALAIKLKSYVSATANQCLGQFRRYIQIWEPVELDLRSDFTESDKGEDRKGKVLPQRSKLYVLYTFHQ